MRAAAFRGREFAGKVSFIAPIVEPGRINARGQRNLTDVDVVEVLVDLAEPGAAGRRDEGGCVSSATTTRNGHRRESKLGCEKAPRLVGARFLTNRKQPRCFERGRSIASSGRPNYCQGISDAWITSGTPSPPTDLMARSTSFSPNLWVVTFSSGKRLEASCASASSQALKL